MFIVAHMLEADGEDIIAAKLLRNVVEISRGLSEMHSHLARFLWFLAKVEGKRGKISLANQLKAEAVNERDLIDGREAAEEDTDESFLNLVG